MFLRKVAVDCQNNEINLGMAVVAPVRVLVNVGRLGTATALGMLLRVSIEE